MDCPKKDCILRLPDGYTTICCIDCGTDFLNYETKNSFSKRIEQKYNKNFEKTCIDTGINIDDLFDKIVDNDKRYELVQKLSSIKKFIHFCVTDFLKNYDNEENKIRYIQYLDLVMNIIEKEQFRLGITKINE